MAFRRPDERGGASPIGATGGAEMPHGEGAAERKSSALKEPPRGTEARDWGAGVGVRANGEKTFTSADFDRAMHLQYGIEREPMTSYGTAARGLR